MADAAGEGPLSHGIEGQLDWARLLGRALEMEPKTAAMAIKAARRYALVLDLGRQGKHAAAAARRTFRPPSIRTPSIPSVTGGDFDRERSIRRLRPMHASSPSVALVWSARTRWCLRLRRADADGEAFCRLALSGTLARTCAGIRKRQHDMLYL